MGRRIANLADIEDFERVPARDRWRGKNTIDVIERSAARFPERPAIQFQSTGAVDETPRIVTYRELKAAMHQMANALAKAGVEVGGVTSLILPNLPETQIAMWGAQARGIVGPINPLLEPAALRDIMRESETQALVIAGPTINQTMWDKACAIADEVDSLRVILQVNAPGESASVARTQGGVPILDFSHALATENGDSFDFQRRIDPEDIAAYFHTGGTTGTPKLAQHSHANQVHEASMMVDFLGFDENSVAIGGLPLFHVNSFFNAGLNMLACGGSAVYLTPDGFRNKDVIGNLWKLIEKYRATYFATVPTVVSALLDVPIGDSDVSSMRFIICGAAPIAPEVFRQFQERTPITVMEAYGMTEGTLFSAGNPLDGEKRVGSIGIRVPYQPMKCVILDEEDRYVRDCYTDEIGTIVFKGPNVFMGYKQADKNKGVFIEGEWLISGDLAREDAEGYFWMTGRSKDLIIRGGHNIDPKVIEDTLSEHPAVSLAAAVGQPDAYAGELPCAYVTLNPEYDGALPDADALQAFVRERIPERAANPVFIGILDAMPTTAVGKIFKPDLRVLAIARVLKDALNEIAPNASIEVEQSERHGLFARVAHVAQENQATARQALDQHTIAYRFEETNGVPKHAERMEG
ncbi:MAG: acyl-CoA synthetase [Pseudomonadota bacterium]